jgi:hypothetical protein
MNFRLENLSEDDFEGLVIMLCEKVLGTGTVSFTKGKDGGRDGRFNGTANAYPSEADQWTGKFIIQAKHTTDYNASCSDKPFFGNQSSIIEKEVPKIIALKEQGEIDNYLLFTNRKDTEARENAVSHIKVKTSLINVDIIGTSDINRWLSQYSDIAKCFHLDKFAMPFEFYDKEIRDVIIFFHETLPPKNNQVPLTLNRPDIGIKNALNSLSEEYYKYIIVEDLNRYHQDIEDFLENPINETYRHFYEEATQELKRVIETHREKFDDFKQVFAFLTEYMQGKEPEKVKKYRNIIAIFFHFMYYQCDIGRSV